MTTGRVKKGIDEADEISRLLGKMPRADVPANFDAEVKRRIANARNRHTLSWPASFAPGFATAAVGIILFGALFFFWTNGPDAGESKSVSSKNNAYREAENKDTVDLKRNKSADVLIAETDSLDKGKTPGSDAAVASGTPGQSPQNRKPPKSLRANRRGGSIVRTLRANPEQTFPEGMRRVPSPEALGEIEVPAALLKLGIESRFNRGWEVVRIALESAAAISGVQKGDVIEAINDKAVDQSSRIPVSRPIQTLFLRRDGKAVVVQIGVK